MRDHGYDTSEDIPIYPGFDMLHTPVRHDPGEVIPPYEVSEETTSTSMTDSEEQTQDSNPG